MHAAFQQSSASSHYFSRTYIPRQLVYIALRREFLPYAAYKMSNIPIGAKLRLQRITASTLSKSAEPNQKEAVTVRSLDDEIARLEAELNAGSGSDPTESDKDESEDSEAMETEETAGVVAVKSSTGRVLALKSALDGNETITAVTTIFS